MENAESVISVENNYGIRIYIRWAFGLWLIIGMLVPPDFYKKSRRTGFHGLFCVIHGGLMLHASDLTLLLIVDDLRK